MYKYRYIYRDIWFHKNVIKNYIKIEEFFRAIPLQSGGWGKEQFYPRLRFLPPFGQNIFLFFGQKVAKNKNQLTVIGYFMTHNLV